jgi:hypothetical protein
MRQPADVKLQKAQFMYGMLLKKLHPTIEAVKAKLDCQTDRSKVYQASLKSKVALAFGKSPTFYDNHSSEKWARVYDRFLNKQEKDMKAEYEKSLQPT